MERLTETCLVTGVAGFIGSHLAERLLRDGFRVIGIDGFTPYYPRPIKERNLAGLLPCPRFTFVEGDLLSLDLCNLVATTDYIFHLAAQPGVRGDWSKDFRVYMDHNVLTTHRLLEAGRPASRLRLLILASSSSVYGDAESLPTSEDMVPRPVSPYGLSKLAAEHLCRLYHDSYGVPALALRYFTVYGPRQRPDMAFHKFIRAILDGDELVIYGDGSQYRDFTYVDDAVQASLLAMRRGRPGDIFNVGGLEGATVNDVVAILEKQCGRRASVRYLDAQRGDVRNTLADISWARSLLGYEPRVSLWDGLRAQVEYISREMAPSFTLVEVAK